MMRGLLLLLMAFLIAGCGSAALDNLVGAGGDSGPQEVTVPAASPSPAPRMLSPHNVTLTVVLPPGLGMSLDTLKVINTAGSFAVAANGEVQVTYWNEGHHYATVTDASGKPLLGFSCRKRG